MKSDKDIKIVYSDKTIKITDAVEALCNAIYNLLSK